MVKAAAATVAVVDDGELEVVVTVAEGGAVVVVTPVGPAVEPGDEHAVRPIDTERRTRVHRARSRRRAWRSSTAQTVLWQS